MYLLETTVEPEAAAPLALVANIGFVNESGLPRDRCVGRNFRPDGAAKRRLA